MSTGRSCWDTTVVLSPSMRRLYLSWGLCWLFYKLNTSVSSSIGGTLSATGNGWTTQKALDAHRVYVGKSTGADTQLSSSCDYQKLSRYGLTQFHWVCIEIVSVSAWLVIQSPFCCPSTFRLFYPEKKVLLQGTQSSSVSYLTLGFDWPPSRLSPFYQICFYLHV